MINNINNEFKNSKCDVYQKKKKKEIFKKSLTNFWQDPMIDIRRNKLLAEIYN